MSSQSERRCSQSVSGKSTLTPVALAGGRRRELIAGKRGRLDPAEIEQRMNGRRLAHAEYEGKNRENNCHWSNVRVHGLSLRVGGQPEWPGLSTHVRRVVSY